MAIEMGTATVALSTEERTWRINIETPKNVIPTITVHRELVKSDANGAIISQEQAGIITRAADKIATDAITAAGITVTGAQLAALVAQAADQWRQEDLKAPPAAPAD